MLLSLDLHWPFMCVRVCVFIVQLKPYFERSLKLPKQNPGAALAEGKTNLTTPVLPIYVSGILSCFKEVGDSYFIQYILYVHAGLWEGKVPGIPPSPSPIWCIPMRSPPHHHLFLLLEFVSKALSRVYTLGIM